MSKAKRSFARKHRNTPVVRSYHCQVNSLTDGKPITCNIMGESKEAVEKSLIARGFTGVIVHSLRDGSGYIFPEYTEQADA